MVSFGTCQTIEDVLHGFGLLEVTLGLLVSLGLPALLHQLASALQQFGVLFSLQIVKQSFSVLQPLLVSTDVLSCWQLGCLDPYLLVPGPLGALLAFAHCHHLDLDQLPHQVLPDVLVTEAEQVLDEVVLLGGEDLLGAEGGVLPGMGDHLVEHHLNTVEVGNDHQEEYAFYVEVMELADLAALSEVKPELGQLLSLQLIAIFELGEFLQEHVEFECVRWQLHDGFETVLLHSLALQKGRPFLRVCHRQVPFDPCPWTQQRLQNFHLWSVTHAILGFKLLDECAKVSPK